eukprot:6789414-Pyramimonas_sp.AAC.1
MPPSAQAAVNDIVSRLNAWRLRRTVSLGALNFNTVAALASQLLGGDADQYIRTITARVKNKLEALLHGRTADQVLPELSPECLSALCNAHLGPSHVEQIRDRLVNVEGDAADAVPLCDAASSL